MPEAHPMHHNDPETVKLQLEIDKHRIIALGRGLLHHVNSATGEHEQSTEHYISRMRTWITQEQAATLGETILEAQNAQTFENMILNVIREPIS